MRLNQTFKLAAASLAMLAVVGCASTQTNRATGEYIDDKVISAKVKAKLIDDPDLKATEINVETFKGVVQLSGFVSSRDDVQKAVKVAAEVGGVKSVKNDMIVK